MLQKNTTIEVHNNELVRLEDNSELINELECISFTCSDHESEIDDMKRQIAYLRQGWQYDLKVNVFSWKDIIFKSVFFYM